MEKCLLRMQDVYISQSMNTSTNTLSSPHFVLCLCELYELKVTDLINLLKKDW